MEPVNFISYNNSLISPARNLPVQRSPTLFDTPNSKPPTKNGKAAIKPESLRPILSTTNPVTSVEITAPNCTKVG